MRSKTALRGFGILAASLVLFLLTGTGLFPQISMAQANAQGTEEDWFKPDFDPEEIRQALGESHVTNRWIYHDLNAARAEAKKTSKPIVALFRCVPCDSAPGLDGAVCTIGGAQASQFEALVREAGGELENLLSRFVAVRMVKFDGVNRNQFRLDRDQPYVVMFLNADGTVYGRYGTRTEQDRKTLPRHNLSSFQQALRRTLELHKHYPQNKALLAAKRGPDEDPAFAEEMVTFKPFGPMKNKPAAVANCVHCHTVGEAEIRQTIAEGALTPRDLWPFPLPESIGLNIDIKDGLKVASVAEGSLARQAGIRSGDMVLRMANQPLVSEADIQWVLHHAPDEGPLRIVLGRGDAKIEKTLALQGDWWKGEAGWRATLGPLRPGLNVRSDPDKVNKGAEPGKMGLLINWPFDAAREVGLRRGDLIVAVDGRTDMLFEGDLLEYLHFDKPELKSIEITFIREGVKSKVKLPLRYPQLSID